MSIDLEALIDELAGRVASRVAETMSVDNGRWSSMQLPPDCPSKNRFHQVCRQIPGAQKMGRVWFVSKDAWDNFRNRPRSPKVVDIIHESDPVALTISKNFRRIV